QPDCPVPEIERPEVIANGLRDIAARAEELLSAGSIEGVKIEYPWAALADMASEMGNGEIREQVLAIIIDAFPEFSDACVELFREAMKVQRVINPEMSVGYLRSIIRDRFGWAQAIDYSAPGARAYFWYRSEEHGENRRGEIGIDEGEDKQTFIDVAGVVNALDRDLASQPANMGVAHFLMKLPHHAHAVSRVQLAEHLPYSEIRGNVIHRDFLPMDGIRFLLSMMGLECSHPHNTRWVRGVFLQGAPTPEDIAAGKPVDWIFPQLRQSSK
ncbi:MAG: hypothetical protein AB7K04_01075, partial [Pseudorhodoplanes sp.]